MVKTKGIIEAKGVSIQVFTNDFVNDYCCEHGTENGLWFLS